MIYLTGDTHCPIDMRKLRNRNLPKDLATKQDYLIICGDCGLVWEGAKEEQYWQKQIEAKKFTTLLIDGNHEDHKRLAEYEEQIWNGGKIHKIQNSIFHLMRGEIFDLDGIRFFTMGGAASTDRDRRKEGFDWFPEEVPSQEECDHAWNNLERVGWKVDLVLTHTAPTRLVQKIGRGDRADHFTDFLQEISEKLVYSHWYFGHFHDDIQLDERHTLLYQKIIPVQKAESNVF